MPTRYDHDLNPRTDTPLDFEERPLGELSAADYDRLGFLCGLEVHQQLATRGKLFCRCPNGTRSTRVDAEVLRHMRPTLSELGEYDGTALMEFKTRKEIVYQLDRRSVCTYEIDDTPPFGIDEEAVQVAIRMARLCDLDLVSELHVMRKQYLDGSIPTGFQRTAMVGLGGEIPFPESDLGPGRSLRIRQLSLEEDSCREVRDVGHRIVFRTDRLGAPLTETVTEPDLLTPLDARAGVLALSRVAHATDRVLRGPGAARQDVNVSIAGGRRIEIKGVPSHRWVPRLVHTEAFRQLELLRIRHALRERGADEALFAIPESGCPWEVSELVADVTERVAGTFDPSILAALARKGRAVAVRLPRFGGLIHHRTQPGLTFVHELAERVRVIACPIERRFLAACDLRDGTCTDGGPEAALWKELARALRAEDDDALVLVWGEERDMQTAAREALIRAADATVGVPSETRQARLDGTTGFERILPGPDRMYPDTDTPPLPIPEPWVATIDASLNERPWERTQRYRELGLGERAAWRLADAPWARLFDALSPRAGAAAARLAAALERVHAVGLDLPRPARLEPLVRALETEDEATAAARREALVTWITRLAEEPALEASTLLAECAAPCDLEACAAELEGRRWELRTADPEATLRWALGETRARWLGRVPVARVRERFGRALAQEVAS